MKFYCKGYRLKMRRILSTVALCLCLAGLTGAALNYYQFDRSEELALHRARNQLLAQQLQIRKDELNTRSLYKITRREVLMSGALIQERPSVETVTITPPGIQVQSHYLWKNPLKRCERQTLDNSVVQSDFKVSLLVDHSSVELGKKPKQTKEAVRWVK